MLRSDELLVADSWSLSVGFAFSSVLLLLLVLLVLLVDPFFHALAKLMEMFVFSGAAAARCRRRKNQEKEEDFHTLDSNVGRDRAVFDIRCRSDLPSRGGPTVNISVDLTPLPHQPIKSSQRFASAPSDVTDQTVLSPNVLWLSNKAAIVSVAKLKKIPAREDNEIDLVNDGTD